MGAARYLIYGFEETARREGVRVLIIDRYVLCSFFPRYQGVVEGRSFWMEW
jgi:hypothetical protein